MRVIVLFLILLFLSSFTNESRQERIYLLNWDVYVFIDKEGEATVEVRGGTVLKLQKKRRKIYVEEYSKGKLVGEGFVKKFPKKQRIIGRAESPETGEVVLVRAVSVKVYVREGQWIWYSDKEVKKVFYKNGIFIDK